VQFHGCTFAFSDEKYCIISQIHQKKKGDLAGYNVFYLGRLLICKGNESRRILVSLDRINRKEEGTLLLPLTALFA